MAASDDVPVVITKDQKFELKRKLDYLRKLKGSGTQLISVYIPAGYQLHEVTNKLRSERSQSTNIKSKTTRTNVGDALEKVIGFLKNLGRTPENGIAVFCGNVSDNPAKVDIKLFSILPPVPLSVQIYRCDSKFFLEPLERMISHTDVYGILAMDGRQATLAYLKGTEVEKLKEVNSTAHAKVHVGGQCLHPGTLVQKSDGVITEIKNLLPNDYLKVSSFKDYSVKDYICPVVTKNLNRSIFLIKTKYPTMEIRATAGHRFFVITENGIGERLAKDLKKGDKVLSVRCIPHKGVEVPLKIGLVRRQGAKLPKFPRYFNSDVAQVIGYLTGDGSFDGDKVVLYESKKELVDLYSKLISKTFGVDTKVRTVDKTKQKGSFAKKTYLELRVYGRNFGRMLKQISKTVFEKSDNRDIPEIVMKSDNNVCSAFIRGLFDAEGYIANTKIEIAMTTEKLIRKLQMLLLRFGIISTVYEKHTDKNQKKRQWGLIISDLESVKIFTNEIGFSLSSKQERCKKICKAETVTQVIRQVPVDGRYVLKQAHKMGMKTRDFDGLNMFFSGKRGIGSKRFKAKVLPVFRKQLSAFKGDSNYKRYKEIVDEMSVLVSSDLIPAVVASIDKLGIEKEVYDLTIPEYKNFIANSFVVHNSAARYQRLITEEIENYYKRIGEYMDRYFMPNQVKGVLIGGPGPAKENFIKMKPFNYQIKVLKPLIDVGYTDEAGINEIIRKGEDIIMEQEAMQERKMVSRFIGDAVTGGLAVYGLKPVIDAIKSYKADSVLISEDLDYTVEIVKGDDGEEDVRIIKPGDKVKPNSETMPLIDYLVNLANRHNIEYHFISTNTTEGAQFKNMFFGIGAFLRYK
ncbi:hypothetical protein J7J90_01350 [Candidatus Micrarchaeota archaeon]|nr:hypothetical protein [Candidatus Micrarchaeota archaeon]